MRIDCLWFQVSSCVASHLAICQRVHPAPEQLVRCKPIGHLPADHLTSCQQASALDVSWQLPFFGCDSRRMVDELSRFRYCYENFISSECPISFVFIPSTGWRELAYATFYYVFPENWSLADNTSNHLSFPTKLICFRADCELQANWFIARNCIVEKVKMMFSASILPAVPYTEFGTARWTDLQLLLRKLTNHQYGISQMYTKNSISSWLCSAISTATHDKTLVQDFGFEYKRSLYSRRVSYSNIKASLYRSSQTSAQKKNNNIPSNFDRHAFPAPYLHLRIHGPSHRAGSGCTRECDFEWFTAVWLVIDRVSKPTSRCEEVQRRWSPWHNPWCLHHSLDARKE